MSVNGDGSHVVGAPTRALAIAAVAQETNTLPVAWWARREGNMADGERRWIVRSYR